GRVLVVGGSQPCMGTTCKSADIFDPATNSFAPSKSVMSEDRFFAWSVLMVDGRVMITSASSATVEIYDPKADAFSKASLVARSGRFLIVGGSQPSMGTTCKSADIFDPATNSFAPSKSVMSEDRFFAWSVLMVDGRVMITSASSATVEIYDPKADAFSKASLVA